MELLQIVILKLFLRLLFELLLDHLILLVALHFSGGIGVVSNAVHPLVSLFRGNLRRPIFLLGRNRPVFFLFLLLFIIQDINSILPLILNLILPLIFNRLNLLLVLVFYLLFLLVDFLLLDYSILHANLL